MTALLLLALAQHPQPQLHGIFPPGARAGGTVELRLTAGADLEEMRALHFSHPGIAAAPVMTEPDRFFPEARPDGRRFKVTVAQDVPPGVYEVRAAGVTGISNSRRFVVSDHDEFAETEPNDDPARASELAVDAVANGTCDAENVDCYRFAARQGQRYVIRAEALPIDSAAIPVLTLTDAAGRQRARAAGSRLRDPLIDFTADADGAFVVRVHDLTYRGGDGYVYRLCVGTGPWVDLVEPPVVQAGVESTVSVIGRNLPGGAERVEAKIAAPADPAAAAPSNELVLRPVEAGADVLSWRLSPRANPVRVVVADQAPVAETEPNDRPEQAQVVTLPAGIAGRFQTRGDRDGFLFEAKKDEKLWIELFSARLGLPVDPVLVVQQEVKDDKGVASFKDVAEDDDQESPMGRGDAGRRYRMAPEDPGLLLSVPADGRYRVVVRDQYDSAQGDLTLAYWLVIRPARPDFRLVGMPYEAFQQDNRQKTWAPVVRRGGALRLRVFAYRREGYAGPIRLEVEGLPPGVTTRPSLIAAGQDSADVVLAAAPDAAAFVGPIRLAGKAEGDGPARPVRWSEVTRGVAGDGDTMAMRMTSAVTIAVDDALISPLSVRAGEEKVYRVSRGGKLSIPVTLSKNADFKEIEKVQVKLGASGIPNPQNQNSIAAKELTLQLDKHSGEMEIDFTDKAPVGSFAFHVRADVDIPYAHNPGGRLERLQADKKRIDETIKQVAEEAAKAREARKQAEVDSAAAAKAFGEASKALEAAKGAGQAEAIAQAEAALKEAEGKAAAAGQAKAAASAEEEKLKALGPAGEQHKKTVADALNKATEAAKEKKIKLMVASPTIVVEVVPVPIVLTPGPACVKPGETAEATVEIAREFGFDGEVKLELKAPDGLAVKLAEAASIAKDQTKGVLKIAADKGVAAGTYPVRLRASLTYNGKALTHDRTIDVKVE